MLLNRAKTLLLAAAFAANASPLLASGVDADKDNDALPPGLSTSTTRIFQHESAVSSRTVHSHLDQSSPSALESVDVHSSSEDEDEKEGGEDGEPLHQPSGQHLLVDIKNVDPLFLNSESRLVRSMIDLVDETAVTLLSYHCHSLVPTGVSCVGVLLESHVSFHTWPKEGVVILDVFTCGDEPLIPFLPTIERLFGVPIQSNDLAGNNATNDDGRPPEPRMLWSHKRRGFREGFDPDYDRSDEPLDNDIAIDFLRKLDLDVKESLVNDETEFQHVDIVREIDPRLNSLGAYERSISGDGSYESLHPEQFQVDKYLFLDGVHQSSLRGEAEYHEALVHPGMLVHPGPRRVAIIGGGEGATLREVLRHRSVEEAVMVEIDGELVEMCREHLPEWNDCSDIEASTAGNCFDDERSTLIVGDAFGWFDDKFQDGNADDADKFDVIIMDALDPEKLNKIASALYRGENLFVQSLFNGLTDEGVYVAQLGGASNLDDPAQEIGVDKDVAHMIDELERVGFQGIHVYDDGHAHFESPWELLVAFKDRRMRARWHRTSAEVEVEIHKRLHRTRSGRPPLRYFDGPTMASYRVPNRAHEVVYCRKEPRPRDCEGLGAPMLGKDGLGDASNDTSDDTTNALPVMPSTWSVMDGLHERMSCDKCDADGNGLSSVVSFCEKGCIDMSRGPPDAVFNPVADRHLNIHSGR